jgi:hypothetical protein
VGGGASFRVTTCAVWRHSMHAWRERWPERLQRLDVKVPAVAACAGAEASVAVVVGVRPGPVDRHGWSSSWMRRRMW